MVGVRVVTFGLKVIPPFWYTGTGVGIGVGVGVGDAVGLGLGVGVGVGVGDDAPGTSVPSAVNVPE
ncbi:MAG TPA: hypothetical protein DC047_07280 [Blastocatellia bacterium]|nr:hypothetical protein [Blastocatellia bacterium]